MIVSAAALYQTQVLADQCSPTYAPSGTTTQLPFYQVWDTLGSQEGYGGHINCFYIDNQGRQFGYLATTKGTPDTDHGANWGEDGYTGAWYCQASAAACLFYDDNSKDKNKR